MTESYDRITDFEQLPEKLQALIKELKFHFNGEIRAVRHHDLRESGLNFANLEIESSKPVLTSQLDGEISWIQPHGSNKMVLEYRDKNDNKWDLTFKGVA